MKIWHLTNFQLSYLLSQVAGLATVKTLVKLGVVKLYLNKTEAFKCYGRNNVTKWIDSGLLIPIKDGQHSAVYRINRLDLECISRSIQIFRVLTDDQFTS